MTGISSQSALVVGAGIAGLTCAIALARQGLSVSVCERSGNLSEVGAGLQLSPNATRLLGRLGLLEPLMTYATLVQSVDLLSASSGKKLLNLPTALVETDTPAPWLCIRRADLQSALLIAAKASPNIALLTGLDFQSAQQTDKLVAAQFIQGSKMIEHTADFLVGADGVWSKVRTQIPSHAKTHFSGYVAWRATVDAHSSFPAAFAELCANSRVGAFLTANAHLVAYPLRGGSQINLVLVTKGTDLAHGWDQEVDKRNLSDALRYFQSDIQSFLNQVPDWRTWPLHQCAPDGAWVSNRIALIGDAAHAMTPFAAQGACMAIEDAFILARQIKANHQDIPSALLTYETLRKPRVSKVVARGRFNRFAYHLPAPLSWARNFVFSARGPKLMNGLDWLYKFDADAD